MMLLKEMMWVQISCAASRLIITTQDSASEDTDEGSEEDEDEESEDDAMDVDGDALAAELDETTGPTPERDPRQNDSKFLMNYSPFFFELQKHWMLLRLV